MLSTYCIISFAFLHSQAASCANAKEQHIPVFLAADNNYAPYVAVAMASILKNTKSFIDFMF